MAVASPVVDGVYYRHGLDLVFYGVFAMIYEWIATVWVQALTDWIMKCRIIFSMLW